MSVQTYDAAQVAVSVSGTPISGFADGTFINVERDENTFQKVVGADGKTSRAKSNNKSGTMTLTLAQTSPSNDVLQLLATADELTSSGIFPVYVKDNSGRSVHFTANAWIEKSAPAEFGKEISNREWIIALADYVPGNAGNAEFEPTT